MPRTGTLREVFDRDRSFEAVKTFKFNGAMFGPGQPFNKDVVSPRRLRQLYDGRYLRMTEARVFVPMHEPIREQHPRELVELGNNIPKPKKKVARVQLNR